MAKRVQNISRVYVDAIHDQPESLIRYLDVKFPILSDKLSSGSGGSPPYQILDFVAGGSSGDVYRAKHTKTGKLYAVKIFKDKNLESPKSASASARIDERKVERKIERKVGTEVKFIYSPQKEVRILEHLSSSIRVVKLCEVFYSPNLSEPIETVETERSRISSDRYRSTSSSGSSHKLYLHMVFELMETSFATAGVDRWLRGLSALKVQTYLGQLLKALDFVHRKGIFHADVKLGNLVIDPKINLLKLIDFGHAQFYCPEIPYPSSSIGTVPYKSPEQLFGCEKLHYSIDVWAAGCIFLQMLFPDHARKFFASDVARQIQNLNAKFGSDALHKFCDKYGLHHAKLDKDNLPGCGWLTFFSSTGGSGGDMSTFSSDSKVSSAALNLLERMLELDPINRITCAEALAHPYFTSTCSNTSVQQLLPSRGIVF